MFLYKFNYLYKIYTIGTHESPSTRFSREMLMTNHYVFVVSAFVVGANVDKD